MKSLQGLTKNEAVELVGTKDMWTHKELRVMISGIKDSEKIKLVVDKILIGDVLQVNGLGHPSIVIAVKGEVIYSVIITSEPTCSSIIRKCNSRIFSNSYFTYTISVHKMDEFKSKLMCVYDNIKELKEIKKLVKQFYKTI